MDTPASKFFSRLKDNPEAFFKLLRDQLRIRLRAEGKWGKWSIEEDIIRSLFETPRANETYVRAGNATGKCLDVDTPIPTTKGWVRMGDLNSGDVLFDESGEQCHVVAVYAPRTAEAYEVSFDDGTSIVADGDHVWMAMSYRDRKRAWRRDWGKNKDLPPVTDWREWWDATRQVTTLEMAGSLRAGGGRTYNWFIPSAKPLCLRKHRRSKNEIDPYTLGFWLGDGTRTCGSITVAHQDAPPVLLNIAKAENIMVIPSTVRRDNGCATYCVVGLMPRLREIGALGKKEVPDHILRSDYNTRLAVLRGIMDSDGTIDRRGGSATLATTELGFATTTAELARSLGLKACEYQRTIQYNGLPKTVYCVSFRPLMRTFCLDRKSSRAKPPDAPYASRQTARTVVSIVPVGKRSVRCIAVDSPRHLYLAGRGFIPTHNTMSAGVAGNAYLFCRQPSYIMYLSTKKEQAKTQAWSQFLGTYNRIRLWCRKNNIGLPDPMVERVEFAPDWWARVYAGQGRGEKDKAMGWSGFHNKYQLFIVDEAPGIPDSVHEMITGNITGSHNVLLAQGNPLVRAGWWHNGQQLPVPEHRRVFKISAKDSPNYRHRLWAERIKEETGKYPDDPYIKILPDGEAEFKELIPGLASYEWINRVEADPQTRPGTPYHDGHVLGEFPQGSEWGLLPWDSIQEAAERSHGWQECIEALGFEDWRSLMSSVGRNDALSQIIEYAEAHDLQITLPDFNRLAVGVDVADGGGNLSVITVLAGNKVLEQRIVDGTAAVQLPPLIEETLRDYEIWSCGIDKPGVGVAPVAVLQARGVEVLEFKGGVPADDADDRQEYVDLNSEMAWALRREFVEGIIEIPDCETLKQQLGSIQWSYSAGNKVRVPKPAKSPDRFDSLRIAFWCQQYGDYSPDVAGQQLPKYKGQFGGLSEW